MTLRINVIFPISLAAVSICSCGGSATSDFEANGGAGSAGTGAGGGVGVAGSGGSAGTSATAGNGGGAGVGQAGSGGSAGVSNGGGGGTAGWAVTLPVGPGAAGAFDGGAFLDAATFVPPSQADASTFTPPPAPAVIDGCAALCSKEATVSCPAQQTMADCRTGCSLVLANPKCTQAAEALFACSKTATAVCGSDGKATLQGCEAQGLLAGGCFLLNAPDPAMSDPCATFCGKTAAAHCPNDGTPADCLSGCKMMGNLMAGCGAGWSAYVQCADRPGATMACGNDNKAWAPGCAPEALTFLACVSALYRTVNAADAGP